MNETVVTIVGRLATDPVLRRVGGGFAVTDFRLASSERRFDKNTSSWQDGHTSFYSVSCWRMLAERAAQQLHKGDPVVLVAKQQVRQWRKDERSGIAIELEAIAIGPDLRLVDVQVSRPSRTSTTDAAASTDSSTAAVPMQATEAVDPWAAPLAQREEPAA